MERKQRKTIPPPAVMIFHEYFDAIAKKLGDEQLGRLWRAVMLYHKGEETTGLNLDEVTGFAFDLMKPSIDATKKKYYDSKANSAYGGFKNACSREEITPPSQEEWEALGRPSLSEWRNMQKDKQSTGGGLPWI